MSHIESDLLAYLDGELSPTDNQAIEAHLARCEPCRVALQELIALRAGLNLVIPAAYETVQLPAEAETRIRNVLARERTRRAQPGSAQERLSGLLAGLAAALRPLSKAAIPLVAVLFLVLTTQAARLPMQGGIQETLVLGGDSYTPGTEAAVRVLVRDQITSQPVADANIAVSLRQPGLARTVYTGSTDNTGSAPVRFAVPDDWQGDAELVVAASSDLGDNELVQPVRLERSYRLLLSSDKPVYQPGETIHLRTLALGKVDGLPAAGSTVRFQVIDAQGDTLLDESVLSSEFGIAATDLPLPSDAPLGPYQLQANLGDTESQLSVQVGQAALPSFQVDVEADAPYYLPGDLVTGRVSAGYFFGKPVAGARVDLRLLGIQPSQDPDQSEQRLFVRDVIGQTTAEGTFPFQFELAELPESAFTPIGAPPDSPQGTIELVLEATVTDTAGDSEFGWESLAMARQPILIDVMAEGGTLRSSVENVLYVLTSYPDGQPAATSLLIQIGSGQVIEETTSDFGLAEIRYTPRADVGDDRAVAVAATDAAGRTGATSVTLPIDQARQSLLLRTDQAVYQVGDTIGVELLASGDSDAAYLDVMKGGQVMLTQSALVENGRATLGIDLTPDLAGTLELTAYQITRDNNVLRDSRVVLVDAPEGLQVTMATDRDAYRPQESAQLTLETRLGERGEQSAVGLSVVNEAVYAQREYQPGFTRTYFILDQALEDAGVDLPDSPPASTAVDTQSQQALRSAQQQAAKASWASYRGQAFLLAAQEVDQQTPDQVNQQRTAALQGLSLALASVLGLFALILAAIVVLGLRHSGVLGQAAGRVLVTLIVLAIAGWSLLLAGQFLRNTLRDQPLPLIPPSASLALAGLLALLWLASLIGLLVAGWRGHDDRAQYAALLVGAFALCLGLLSFVTNQGAGLPASWWLVVAIASSLVVASVLLLGWGLRREGARSSGNLALLLGLCTLTLGLLGTTAEVPGQGQMQPMAVPLPLTDSLEIIPSELAMERRASQVVQPGQAPAVEEVEPAAEESALATEVPAPAAEEPAPAGEAPAPAAAKLAPAAEEAAVATRVVEYQQLEEPAEVAGLAEASPEPLGPEGAPTIDLQAFLAEPPEPAPAEPAPVDTVATPTVPLASPTAAPALLAQAEAESPTAIPSSQEPAVESTPLTTPLTLAAPEAALSEEGLAPEPAAQAAAAGEDIGTPSATPTSTVTLTATLSLADEAVASEVEPFEADSFTRALATAILSREETPTSTITTTSTPSRTVTASPAPELTLADRTPAAQEEPEERAAAALAPEPDLTTTPTASTTPTPSPTPTATAMPTPEPTSEPSVLAQVAEATRQAGETPTATATPTPTATSTATASPTPAPQPTATAQPAPALEVPPAPAPPSGQPARPEQGGIGGGGDQGGQALPAQPTPVPLESLPIIRERFPQTLYWNPEAITTEDGRLQLTIPTGDEITSWRINAVAVDRNGRLGSASAPLLVFQPLFLQANLPEDMLVGDEIRVSVQIFNHSAQPLAATFSAQASAGLEVSAPQQPLSLPPNEVLAVPLLVRAADSGAQSLILTVQADGVSDARQATILVWPQP